MLEQPSIIKSLEQKFGDRAMKERLSLMLRYLKRSGDQSRPHRIKLFLFCAIPSTTNNLMNNQDLKFSAPPKDNTIIGTILDPKLMSQDRKQAQTPIDPTTGLSHNQQYGKVIMPNESTLNDSNEITLNIHEYVANTHLFLL